MVCCFSCPLAVVLLLIAPFADGLLSKSDRKEKTRKKVGESKKSVEEENVFAGEPIDLQLKDYSGEVTINNILSEHDKLCTDEKTFDHAVLGYVTPWNNGGYDIAKWATKKFTHISPVWFQFKPEVKQQKTCSILGTQDLDKGWLADVRLNNSDILFVPRFILDGSNPDNINQLLYDVTWQTNCAFAFTNFLKKNGMHGAVIEIWLQILALMPAVKEELIELIAHWAQLFHKADLELILPVPAALNAKYEPNGLLSSTDFAELAKHVDYVNVMTYDYHSERFVGIAPFSWVRFTLEYLLSESPVSAPKVLMGINFYGYASHQSTMKAVIGKEFLEYLDSESASLDWNPTTKEHFIKTKDHGMCVYPTIASIKNRLELADFLNVGLGIWELGQGLNYFTCLL